MSRKNIPSDNYRDAPNLADFNSFHPDIFDILLYMGSAN